MWSSKAAGCSICVIRCVGDAKCHAPQIVQQQKPNSIREVMDGTPQAFDGSKAANLVWFSEWRT
jgi:hypothetical protein